MPNCWQKDRISLTLKRDVVDTEAKLVVPMPGTARHAQFLQVRDVLSSAEPMGAVREGAAFCAKGIIGQEVLLYIVLKLW